LLQPAAEKSVSVPRANAAIRGAPDEVRMKPPLNSFIHMPLFLG
jgi:hypothetical protein